MQSEELQLLLEELARAARQAVEESDEVKKRFKILSDLGFHVSINLRAVASLADGTKKSSEPQPVYLLTPEDVRFLQQLGISPDRHRSHQPPKWRGSTDEGEPGRSS